LPAAESDITFGLPLLEEKVFIKNGSPINLYFSEGDCLGYTFLPRHVLKPARAENSLRDQAVHEFQPECMTSTSSVRPTLARDQRKVILFLDAEKQQIMGLASRIIIAGDHYVVTAGHVYDDSKYICSARGFHSKEPTCRVLPKPVVHKRYNDVVFLKVSDNLMSNMGISVRKVSHLKKVGLVINGYHNGIAYTAADGNFLSHDSKSNVPFNFKHTASTVPGMSGAAILNNRGSIVGLHLGAVPTATSPYNIGVALEPLIKLLFKVDIFNAESWTDSDDDAYSQYSLDDDFEVDLSRVKCLFRVGNDYQIMTRNGAYVPVESAVFANEEDKTRFAQLYGDIATDDDELAWIDAMQVLEKSPPPSHRIKPAIVPATKTSITLVPDVSVMPLKPAVGQVVPKEKHQQSELVSMEDFRMSVYPAVHLKESPAQLYMNVLPPCTNTTKMESPTITESIGRLNCRSKSIINSFMKESSKTPQPDLEKQRTLPFQRKFKNDLVSINYSTRLCPQEISSQRVLPLRAEAKLQPDQRVSLLQEQESSSQIGVQMPLSKELSPMTNYFDMLNGDPSTSEKKETLDSLTTDDILRMQRFCSKWVMKSTQQPQPGSAKSSSPTSKTSRTNEPATMSN
jgi:hypothetical protein